jgi:hypothetical protein
MEVAVPDQTPDEADLRAILQRMQSLWSDVTSGRAEAETIASAFTEDADCVVGDGTYLRGRGEIAAYYRTMVESQDAFGTSLRERPSSPKPSACACSRRTPA